MRDFRYLRPAGLTLAALLFMAGQPHAEDRPAKHVFGFIMDPLPMEARAIGSYARGCLAGGRELPVNGPAWQAMRLSRNRNWGHPALLDYIEQLARDTQKLDGPTARGSEADRACEPPDRAGRGHLVEAYARPASEPQRAGAHVRRVGAGRQPAFG